MKPGFIGSERCSGVSGFAFLSAFLPFCIPPNAFYPSQFFEPQDRMRPSYPGTRCALFNILLPTVLGQSTGNPQTFWDDYPSCEEQCHISVWEAEQCSLANSCPSSDGCLVLNDSCLCVTSSWLTAVSQCIGATCGASAVSEAAGIALQGCNSYDITMSMSQQAIIAAGLAAVPSSASSPTSTSTTPTSSAQSSATTSAAITSTASSSSGDRQTAQIQGS
jgi:hypothetical protein